MEIPEASPEALRSLTNSELNGLYDEAVVALKAAQEAVLCVQDERYRRYRIVRMLHMKGDWACGTLSGLRVQANAPETY